MYFDYNFEPQGDYLCIDCKSFYSSVECVVRGLDPLETMLVVLSGGERRWVCFGSFTNGKKKTRYLECDEKI